MKDAQNQATLLDVIILPHALEWDHMCSSKEMVNSCSLFPS